MTRATPDCLELLEGLLKLNPNDRLRNVFKFSATVKKTYDIFWNIFIVLLKRWDVHGLLESEMLIYIMQEGPVHQREEMLVVEVMEWLMVNLSQRKDQKLKTKILSESKWLIFKKCHLPNWC